METPAERNPKIWGWVYGEDTNYVFDVPESQVTNTVEELKQSLLSKKIRLRNADRENVNLYLITLSDDPDAGDEILRRFTLEDSSPLGPSEKLSSLNLSSNSIIIIDCPQTEIWCWLYPHDNGLFEVDISNAKTVANIKKHLKEDNTFRNMDFDLYLTTLPDRRQGHLNSVLKRWSFENKISLDPLQKISELNLSRSSLIVVHSPVHDTTEMTLNCWVRGEDASRMFNIGIARNQIVLALEYSIIDKKLNEFRELRDEDVRLYKVCIPYSEDLCYDGFEALNLEQHLDPSSHLFQVFPHPPPEMHLNIVIDGPFYPDRRAFVKHYRSNPPLWPCFVPSYFSEDLHILAQNTSFNLPRTTIPHQLLHDVFKQFPDNCDTHEITAADDSLSEELRLALMGDYPDESMRGETIRRVFSESGLSSNMANNQVTYLHGHCYIIVESESCNNAMLRYFEATEEYAIKMRHLTLPCIILILTEPCIIFAGAAWNFHPVIEPLVSELRMDYHPMDTSMRTKAARHLGAFKKAVLFLEKYYQDLSIGGPLESTTIAHPHAFSYCIPLRKFKNVIQPFPNKLVFFGVLADDSEQPVCIKFASQYSSEVHRLCALLGCAPTLYALEKLGGEWFMVVMDKLPQDQYRSLHVTPQNDSLVDNIRDVLERLHKANYVHGDIRDINILVSESDNTKFMLIDFDWAGKAGEARYPERINRGEGLWRPEGAVSGALITADHDIDMLNHILTGNKY